MFVEKGRKEAGFYTDCCLQMCHYYSQAARFVDHRLTSLGRQSCKSSDGGDSSLGEGRKRGFGENDVETRNKASRAKQKTICVNQ